MHYAFSHKIPILISKSYNVRSGVWPISTLLFDVKISSFWSSQKYCRYITREKAIVCSELFWTGIACLSDSKYSIHSIYKSKKIYIRKESRRNHAKREVSKFKYIQIFAKCSQPLRTNFVLDKVFTCSRFYVSNTKQKFSPTFWSWTFFFTSLFSS